MLPVCPYATQIKAACEQYAPWLDPMYAQAQLWQESNWKPFAASPAGAHGIAQFMDATWDEVVSDLDFSYGTMPEDTDYAIPAYAYYMNKLWQQWTAPRTPEDRRRLAMAAYNTGMGNMLKAQQLTKDDTGRRLNDYASIAAQLIHVTGEAGSAETLDYIVKIEGYYLELTS